MTPFGARVGIGAFLAAHAVAAAGAPVAAVIAGAAALGAGTALAAARPAGRRAGARTLAPAAVGAWLVVARVVLGGDGSPPPAPPTPAGDGPWSALVVAVSAPRDGQQRLTVTLDEPPGVVLAVSAPRYPEVGPGDRVGLAGRPAPPPEGGYGDFLRRTGVAGTLRSRVLEHLGEETGAAAVLERIRRAAGDALERALPEPAAGLAAGILVGLRDRVDRDLAADFTTTGLSHVVAISGWNIAIVAGLVGALLAGRARRTRSGAILLAIVAYTLLAGASASVVRAAAMAGVALLARESGRPGTAAAALGWAVTLMVVASPASAADVGLQLSAAATAGLIAWSAPLAAVIERRAGWLPGWVREGLGVSLAAQAATLPIVLVAFGRLAPLAPVTNLVVVPLVPPAMAAGTVALGCGAFEASGLPVPAAIGGIPAAIILGLLVGIVRLAADLPLASVVLPPPVAVTVAASVVVILVAASRRRVLGAWVAALGGWPGSTVRRDPGLGSRRPAPGDPWETAGRSPAGTVNPGTMRPRTPSSPRTGSSYGIRALVIVAALALAVLVVAAASRPDGRAHVTVLDVGQGDAILITGPTGGRILVDGGPDPDRLLVALDARVPPWDRRLDLIVLTHPHDDHVAGLPLVLERYRVGAVAEAGLPGRSPSYLALAAGVAAREGVTTRLAAGQRLVVDSIELDVMWPDADRVPAAPADDGSLVNDVSVVLLGTFEGRRFLLTGDAEAGVENTLVRRGLPQLDLLKVGHHGSRTSTGAALVAATRPAVSVISVGSGNTHGHPAREVLQRLAEAGSTILRTDQVGTIDVALDARGIVVRTERRGSDLPAASRDARRLPPASASSPAGRRRVAGPAFRLPYDRRDVRPYPVSRGRHPPVARPARLARPPRSSGRRGRRLARGSLRPARREGRSRARRGRGPPP